MAKETAVSETYLLGICDDIGTCWHDLGIKLGLPLEILDNIDKDYSKCREKAKDMLCTWMKRKGDSATVQCLIDALEEIEQKRIAGKLLRKEKMKTELEIARTHSANLSKEVRLTITGLKKEVQKLTKKQEGFAEAIKSLLELCKAKDKDNKEIIEEIVQKLETIERLSTEESEKEVSLEGTARLTNMCDQMEEKIEKMEKISQGDNELDEKFPDYNNNAKMFTSRQKISRQEENGSGLDGKPDDGLITSPVGSIHCMSEGNQTCPRCSGFENELNVLRKASFKHNDEKQALKTEKKNMEEKVTKRDNEVKDLKKVIAREANERKEIEQRKNNLVKENKKYVDRNKKLLGEKKNLEEEKKNLEGEMNNLKDQLENLRKEKSDLKKNVEEKRRECDELVEKAKHDSTEIQRLHIEVDEMQSSCKILEQEIIRCKNFVSKTFLPSEKDFQKTGVIGNLRNRKVPGIVVATRSSEGPGDANDILDNQTYTTKGRTCSCGTAEIEKSWWCVDLGANYLLFLTHYTLRHGKKEGDSILRRWKLQGSIDGQEWKDITTKRTGNQPEFRGRPPYVTGTWPVGGEVGAFRYFKIVQTGRNSSRKYGIYLYGIEFYGVLIKA